VARFQQKSLVARVLAVRIGDTAEEFFVPTFTLPGRSPFWHRQAKEIGWVIAGVGLFFLIHQRNGANASDWAWLLALGFLESAPFCLVKSPSCVERLR
jgi:hypothetical protein